MLPLYNLSSLLFFVGFLLLQTFFAYAQHNGNLFIQNYRAKKDYNGHTQNWTCYQSPTGLLYMGNNEGLIEYDGVRFTNIQSPGILRSLITDNNGVLYAGAKGDFGYFKPNLQGKLSYISLAKTMPEAEQKFSNRGY
jgi:hypothetical protein